MLGAIIGDIAGSRFEFDNHRTKDFELFSDQCAITDDSIMTLAVAKAIMEAEAIRGAVQGEGGGAPDYYAAVSEMTVKFMRQIGQRYPDCGYGGRFYQWMFSVEPKPYNSYGNGAAMRVGPAGYAARTESEACELALAVTRVTHNHKEGIKGAKATAVAIFLARTGHSKEEIRERIAGDYYPLDFTIDAIRGSYEFNETCQETVPQAIEAFLESVSFEDAVRTAVSVGGDSDTLAAITGSIAEAYYGIPEELQQKALSYLDETLYAIYEEWVYFVSSRDSEKYD